MNRAEQDHSGHVDAEDANRLAEDDDELLACGRSTDVLLEQAFDGRAGQLDDHQRDCSHCREVLAETARLWAPLREAGAHLETPPPGLRAAVMRAVRDLARQGWSLVLPGHPGVTRVSAAVVTTIAERALLGVRGVRSAWARASAPTAATNEMVLQLTMVAEYGSRIPLVARAARTEVRKALAAMVSPAPVRIDIRVDGITTP